MACLGGGPEIVEHCSRLHSRHMRVPIDVEHSIHVLAEIEHDGRIARRPGQIRGAAAGDDRCVISAADGDGGLHIFGVARDDNANRNLPVVGRVGRVKRPVAIREPHLAANRARQIGRKLRGVDGERGGFNGIGPRWGRGRRLAATSPNGSEWDVRHRYAVPLMSEGEPAGIGVLELETEAGPRQIGMERALYWRERAIEEEVLDANVVVEVLDVAEPLERAGRVNVQ